MFTVKRFNGFKKVLGLAIVCMTMLCSCGAFDGMTNQEAYDTGYAIGRIISGN